MQVTTTPNESTVRLYSFAMLLLLSPISTRVRRRSRMRRSKRRKEEQQEQKEEEE